MTMLSKYAPKECAQCGKLHTCTGTVRCPCFEVELPEDVLDYIATHFDECLCNDCMEELKSDFSKTLTKTLIVSCEHPLP